VEPEETSTATQRLGKHVPEATNAQTTTEVLLVKTLSFRSVQSDYKRRELRFSTSRVLSAGELCEGG
jgi:hypothetical protein